MKPIIILYVRLFLIIGAIHWFLCYGFDLLHGNGVHLKNNTMIAFFFSSIMSYIIVLFHKNRLKKSGINKITKENYKLSQTRTITSAVSKNDLIKVLQTDPDFKKLRILKEDNNLKLRSGINGISWGEEIIITQQNKNNGTFEYQVSSSPRRTPILVDYGINLRNIKRIENLMTKNT